MRQILIRTPKRPPPSGQLDLCARPGGAPGGRSLANGLGHYRRQRGHTLRTSRQAMAHPPPPDGETEVPTSRPGTERKDLR